MSKAVPILFGLLVGCGGNTGGYLQAPCATLAACCGSGSFPAATKPQCAERAASNDQQSCQVAYQAYAGSGFCAVGGGDTGNGSAACSNYLTCLQQYANSVGGSAQQAYDTAKMQYGSGSACSASDATRAACDSACSQALTSLEQTFQCGSGSGGDGGGGDGGDGGTTSGPACPLVMLVVDRSGSTSGGMDTTSASPTRLDVEKDAIKQLLADHGSTIPFGLTTFNESGATCADGIEILVEPGSGSTRIANALPGVQPGGGSNPGEAVDRVAHDPIMKDSSRPSGVIVLITDGVPNCSSITDTVKMVQNAHDAGFSTYVIGIGADATAGQAQLQQISQAAGTTYYPAPTAMALNAALGQIVSQIAGAPGALCTH